MLGYFWCFQYPPNSDMDYVIVNVCRWLLRGRGGGGGGMFIHKRTSVTSVIGRTSLECADNSIPEKCGAGSEACMCHRKDFVRMCRQFDSGEVWGGLRSLHVTVTIRVVTKLWRDTLWTLPKLGTSLNGHSLPLPPLPTSATTPYLCHHSLPLPPLPTSATTPCLYHHSSSLWPPSTSATTPYLCNHALPLRPLLISVTPPTSNSKHWFTTSFLQPLPYLVTPQGPENCQLTRSFLLVLKE